MSSRDCKERFDSSSPSSSSSSSFASSSSSSSSCSFFPVSLPLPLPLPLHFLLPSQLFLIPSTDSLYTPLTPLSGHYGAFLADKDPALVERLVRRASETFKVPIICKMRLKSTIEESIGTYFTTPSLLPRPSPLTLFLLSLCKDARICRCSNPHSSWKD
jgi:hypothetical protein